MPLQFLLDAITDAVIVVDAAWRCTYANAAGAGLCGRPADQVAGITIGPDQLASLGGPLHAAGERAMRTREPARVEARDGATQRWVEGRVYPVSDGGLLIIIAEVPERHHRAELVERWENRFRALVEATAEAVWIVDPDGSLAEPEPSLVQFTGCAPAQLAGQRWLSVIHPDDRGALLAAWAQARASRASFTAEYRVRRADGAWRLMLGRAVPVLDDAGQVREWIGVSTDVTDQRATERELRASEARLARAQEIAGIGIWEMDGATRRTIMSDTVWRMHGLQGSESAYTHEDWLAALSPADRAAADAGIEAALRDGVPYRKITRFRRPDGTLLITEAYAERVIGEDGSVRLLGTLQDVTQRVQHELALRESEQRLALIFNSTFDSMFLMSVEGDDEFRVRLVNAAFSRITGMTPQQVVGRELREIAQGQTLGVMVNRYHEAVRTRRVVEYEERHELQGETRVMETRLIPVMDRAGTVTHLLGVSRDISERRRMEAERHALDLQLQHAQKLESLGVLAGGVAHDFNNLLVGILGNASLALLDLPPGSEVANAIGDIEKTARQAAELTNQLLAYSGKGRFVVSTLNLARLVTEMSPVWRSALSKRAQVTLALDQSIPPVEGDASQLRQVVLNMMTNASDALGSEAGTIVVRTGVERLDERALRAARFSTGARPGEYVFVEVKDNGSGMDAETVERIFEPFFTTRFTGRGLGLAATLGIVRGHHGVITVRSAPGEGTVFRVSLPARRDLQLPRAEGAPAPVTSSGSGTVLVIDDEDSVRTAIRRILGRAGYDTLDARNGAEGLATFSAHSQDIDCVVLDLTMPGMSGAEVAAAIRQMAPSVRIVLASGFDAATVTGLVPGEHVFLHKPFTARQLIDAVDPGHGS